tara:strand:+ start:307 stop:855 length:549 start_codon:yes stop_codon:yes gene_type:complete
MNRVQFVLGSLLLGGILIFGFYGLFVHAQDTEEYQKNPAYIEECGACHLAYPPGLMPSKTWDKVMTGLSDHFGENAELDDETAQLIMSYLQQESLRPGKPTVMSEMLRNLPQNPPLRMTEFPAFLAAHEIIGEQLEMESFPEGFLSPCADCHRQAADGIFEKDRMHPGYGPSNWGGAPSSNR